MRSNNGKGNTPTSSGQMDQEAVVFQDSHNLDSRTPQFNVVMEHLKSISEKIGKLASRPLPPLSSHPTEFAEALQQGRAEKAEIKNFLEEIHEDFIKDVTFVKDYLNDMQASHIDAQRLDTLVMEFNHAISMIAVLASDETSREAILALKLPEIDKKAAEIIAKFNLICDEYYNERHGDDAKRDANFVKAAFYKFASNTPLKDDEKAELEKFYKEYTKANPPAQLHIKGHQDKNQLDPLLKEYQNFRMEQSAQAMLDGLSENSSINVKKLVIDSKQMPFEQDVNKIWRELIQDEQERIQTRKEREPKRSWFSLKIENEERKKTTDKFKKRLEDRSRTIKENEEFTASVQTKLRTSNIPFIITPSSRSGGYILHYEDNQGNLQSNRFTFNNNYPTKAMQQASVAIRDKRINDLNMQNAVKQILKGYTHGIPTDEDCQQHVISKSEAMDAQLLNKKLDNAKPNFVISPSSTPGLFKFHHKDQYNQVHTQYINQDLQARTANNKPTDKVNYISEALVDADLPKETIPKTRWQRYKENLSAAWENLKEMARSHPVKAAIGIGIAVIGIAGAITAIVFSAGAATPAVAGAAVGVGALIGSSAAALGVGGAVVGILAAVIGVSMAYRNLSPSAMEKELQKTQELIKTSQAGLESQSTTAVVEHQLNPEGTHPHVTVSMSALETRVKDEKIEVARPAPLKEDKRDSEAERNTHGPK